MANRTIRYIKKVENGSDNKELMMVTTRGKAYKRQYYQFGGTKKFIYNKAWYTFRFNELGYAADVKFEKPYKATLEEVEQAGYIRLFDNYDNPFNEIQNNTEAGTDTDTDTDTEETDDAQYLEEMLDESEKSNTEADSEITEEQVEEEPEIDWTQPVKHEKYEVIKTCIENNIPVYLAGPAGAGKNHVLEQIAAELGMNFYFSNSVQQEYKLTGFIDAGGDYHDTQFYKACTDENECIFFLDEMDASIPEVLVLLNAAIANGYFEFPNGKVNLDNVHFVAAGNTVGNGADDKYTGRMVIDQATLDRFAIIEFDYDRNIELHIAKGNKELVEFIHNLRDYTERAGIRATFSYRCISMATKLEATNTLELKEILRIAVVKGLDKDTINTLNIGGYTRYHRALNELRA